MLPETKLIIKSSQPADVCKHRRVFPLISFVYLAFITHLWTQLDQTYYKSAHQNETKIRKWKKTKTCRSWQTDIREVGSVKLGPLLGHLHAQQTRVHKVTTMESVLPCYYSLLLLL